MTDLTLTIGANRIDVSSGYIVTTLPDGKRVDAVPTYRPVDYARARELGYGDDVCMMHRDHEILHTLVPHLLGLPESRVFRGVAEGAFWPQWREEEAILFAVARYCRTVGVDVLEMAQRVTVVGSS